MCVWTGERRKVSNGTVASGGGAGSRLQTGVQNKRLQSPELDGGERKRLRVAHPGISQDVSMR